MTGPPTESIQELVQTALGELEGIDDPESLDQWRVAYLGRRGRLTQVLRGIAQLDVDQRREAGALGNQAKRNLEERLDQRVQEVNSAHLEQTFARDQLDVTLPGRPSPVGRLHPTTQILREICDAFAAMGFSIVEWRGKWITGSPAHWVNQRAHGKKCHPHPTPLHQGGGRSWRKPHRIPPPAPSLQI